MNELTDQQEALARRITTAQIVAMQRELAEARALIARLHGWASTHSEYGSDAAWRDMGHIAALTAPYATPKAER